MLNQHDKNIHLFAPIAHPSQILFKLALTPRSHHQIFSQTCDTPEESLRERYLLSTLIAPKIYVLQNAIAFILCWRSHQYIIKYNGLLTVKIIESKYLIIAPI